jgi:hypothetical protein
MTPITGVHGFSACRSGARCAHASATGRETVTNANVLNVISTHPSHQVDQQTGTSQIVVAAR